MAAITVHHFSDILCVWAYIAEIRIRELHTNFGDKVELDLRTIPVFGNVHGKMANAWKDRGGLPGYAKHIHEIAAQFPHAEIHRDTWVKQVPHSSLPAHISLCAVRLAEQTGRAAPDSHARFAGMLRKAFFAEALDVSDNEVIRDLLQRAALPVEEIEAFIADGEAHARLAEDQQMAMELDVRSSPTMIFNDGRQRLVGNVGYRIIEANVRELLERPEVQHSWC